MRKIDSNVVSIIKEAHEEVKDLSKFASVCVYERPSKRPQSNVVRLLLIDDDFARTIMTGSLFDSHIVLLFSESPPQTKMSGAV
jgi:hypothetical protein